MDSRNVSYRKNNVRNCKGPWRKVLARNLPRRDWHKIYAGTKWKPGYKFIAFEPADEFTDGWPSTYHRLPGVRALLNASAFTRSLQEWREVVHVLSIRHPIQRALSAFGYRYFGMARSALDECRRQGVRWTPDACLRQAMEDLAPGLHSGQGRVAAGGGPGGSERKEHNPYYQHRRKLRQEQRKERHPCRQNSSL